MHLATRTTTAHGLGNMGREGANRLFARGRGREWRGMGGRGRGRRGTRGF